MAATVGAETLPAVAVPVDQAKNAYWVHLDSLDHPGWGEVAARQLDAGLLSVGFTCSQGRHDSGRGTGVSQSSPIRSRPTVRQHDDKRHPAERQAPPMTSALSSLGVSTPVLAAPMAGGPSTSALVIAAAGAGGLGFLAGGYKDVEALAEEIDQVRSSGVLFGVNLFAPNPLPVDPAEFRRYARTIAPEGQAHGVDLLAVGTVEDDDHWSDKIELLLSRPVPVVSFTFAVPDPAVITSLRAAGTLVIQTVTSPSEALLAAEAGADMLVVQAPAAGGHSGTFTPQRTPADIPLPRLLGEVRRNVSLPLIAAGGLATPTDVVQSMRAGATAAMVGTVLLLADESGASLPHRAALTGPADRGTVVTRAFTGRPARALRNRFTDRYTDLAPLGYPALHHLTSPMRRAAIAAQDPERINLWAGTGHRHATAEPAARILRTLVSRL
ncbi:nitronate monooxygenase [Nonomuraea sp. H19]|uniref:nitronate monooxygenase n=1 Tax=Nonomuraea sp. H19 TaxID=3452206 RepID=UPI003F8BEFA1